MKITTSCEKDVNLNAINAFLTSDVYKNELPNILQKLTLPTKEKRSSVNVSMQDQSLLLSNLNNAKKGRNMAVHSSHQYNSLVYQEEKLPCHNVGYGTKQLALPAADSDDEESISNISSECCSDNSGNQKSGLKISENAIKKRAYERQVTEVFEFFKCGKSCAFSGKCKNRFSAFEMVNEIKTFWGDKSNPLTTIWRRHSVINKLIKSYFRDVKTSVVQFLFTVGESDSRVCESAYLHIIGHPKSKLWNKSRDKIIEQMKSGTHTDISSLSVEDITKAIKQKKDVNERRSHIKLEHCQNFIKDFGATNGSKSPLEREFNLVILPFEYIRQLYIEYTFFCTKDNSEPASDETFRIAYNQLRKQGLVRFTRGKGTFPTCDICNNANDLLANSQSNKMSSQIRDLVVKMKQLHLKQQAGERIALAAKINEAKTKFDEDNNPTHGVFFGDGMTVYAGRTPKYGIRHGKRDAAFFENRVFGVEVYCGPVSGEILIHTDDLVRGGSNFIVEVSRRLISELGTLLNVHNMTLPKNIHFQWDNCGENKNKTTFMFCSLLVELGYFETVTVGFLIIGHTHASIDQYFGVLRGLIASAKFIASPLALQHLFALRPINKDSTYRPPIAQIKLHFIHDYVSFFEPYWNPKIKNYQTPYQFKFFSIGGKAVCQYKQFSEANLKWLPVLPTNSRNSTLNQGNVYNIEDNFTLASQAGSDALMNHLGLKDPSSQNLFHEVLSTKPDNFLDSGALFRQAFPTLQSISIKAMHEQELRRVDEENGITDVQRYDVEEEEELPHLQVQKTLQQMSNKESGFLTFIDYTASYPTPPLISTLQPLPINPKTLWEKSKAENIANIVELEKAEAKANSKADALADQELVDDDNNVPQSGIPNDDDNDANGDIHDQLNDLFTKQHQNKRGDKSKHRKAIPKNKKTNDQFIINALANMKAAAKYMTEHKLAKGLVEKVDGSLQKWGSQVFRRKFVTDEDCEYYSIRLSHESILDEVNNAVLNAPVFKWVPDMVLSERQQQEKQKRKEQSQQEYEKSIALYKEVLSRPKENSNSEVITGRVINIEAAKREKKVNNKEKKDRAKAKILTAAKNAPKSDKINSMKSNFLPQQVAHFVDLNKSEEHQQTGMKRQAPSSKRSQHTRKVRSRESSEESDSEYQPSCTANKFSSLQVLPTQPSNQPSTFQVLSLSDSGNRNSSSSRSSSGSSSGEDHEMDESEQPRLISDNPYFHDEDSNTEGPPSANNFTRAERNFNENTTLSSHDRSIANKLVRVLKKKAKDLNPNSTYYKKKCEDEKISEFKSSTKSEVRDALECPNYARSYLPIAEAFGITLRNTYTEELLKGKAVRQQCLDDIVDSLISKWSPTSSSFHLTVMHILTCINDELHEFPE